MNDLREELRAIYATRGDRPFAAAVVEEAADPLHPLHGKFEWDDKVAGPKYRMLQAQELIRSVKITFKEDDDGPHEVREWVSIQMGGRSRDYLPITEVVVDEFAYRMLLQEMERDIESIKRKYGHLEEFVAILREVAEVS